MTPTTTQEEMTRDKTAALVQTEFQPRQTAADQAYRTFVCLSLMMINLHSTVNIHTTLVLPAAN